MKFAGENIIPRTHEGYGRSPKFENENIDGYFPWASVLYNFISGFNHVFSIITLSETWFDEDSSNLIDIDDLTG